MASPHDRLTPVQAVYASLLRRLWAFTLDVIFVACLLGLLFDVVPKDARPGAGIGMVALYLLWSTTLEGSVGKRLAGLRVVQASDGEALGWVRAFIREMFIKPVSLFAAGLGFLWMLDQPRRQTWHDLLAGSVVVRELPLEVAPAWGTAPPWQEPASKGP